MKQRPIAQGLMLCEQVVIEETTRNVTLVNCFTHRTVRRFPSEPVSFVSFALLTDGRGDILIEVVIERLDTLQETHRLASRCSFASPLQLFRCTVRFRECSFPIPGDYQVTLLADGEILAQRKMTLVQREEK